MNNCFIISLTIKLMQKIFWRPENRAVVDLKNWDKNPRKISKENFANLKNKIVERGFHDVIVVDQDLTVLSGNQRRKALLELGIKEVTVLLPDRRLTEDEREKISLESNISDGQWELNLLKDFKIDTLNDVGFEPEIISDIWGNIKDEIKNEDFDEAKELAKIKVPETKPGDLIELGEHRLICGDSNDPDVLKRLFGDKKTSLVYCDPIYNLKVSYDSGIGGKQNYGGNVNDDRTEDEYISFLRKNISTALTVANKDCHFFYWNTEQQIWILQTLYREFNIANKRVCLWIKNGHNPTPGVAFNKCYEPCVYGTLGSPYLAKKVSDLTEVMNKEIGTGNQLIEDINIWTAKRVSTKELEHATMKPPELHENAIKRCTKPGDIILDSFGGSGSTLIAAEKLKRRAYLVELEPVFCDLIIRRFEKSTGQKAKIINS